MHLRRRFYAKRHGHASIHFMYGWPKQESKPQPLALQAPLLYWDTQVQGVAPQWRWTWILLAITSPPLYNKGTVVYISGWIFPYYKHSLVVMALHTHSNVWVVWNQSECQRSSPVPLELCDFILPGWFCVDTVGLVPWMMLRLAFAVSAHSFSYFVPAGEAPMGPARHTFCCNPLSTCTLWAVL